MPPNRPLSKHFHFGGLSGTRSTCMFVYVEREINIDLKGI